MNGTEETRDVQKEPMAPGDTERAQEELARMVDEKARRRIRARTKEERSLWFGLGAFGVVGWSIAAPTLLGAAIGFWLDYKLGDPFSWTLALLLAGVVAGCFNAWYWLSQQQRAMEAEKRNQDHE